MTYDPHEDARQSYTVAIEAMGEKLRSFRKEVIGDCTLYLGDCREMRQRSKSQPNSWR